MAYLAIKKVNGQHYAYLQESYREGGKVRTRTVEYLGAIAPAVADQVRTTRRQLGQADRAALVASVRAAAMGVAEGGDAPQQSPEQSPPNPRAAHSSPATALITTENELVSKPIPPQFLQWPDDLPGYSVSPTALQRTRARFADRLQVMGFDPSAMPQVAIRYGHPDGLRRNRDGSFTITASRKPQNKRHQLNKTRLWQHMRQAMSLAYLDALAEARPDLHHQLQSELDESHKATKQLLVQSLARASTTVERLGLSLQLSIWHSVPQKLIKRKAAEEFGQASFETLKDWRSEAAFVLAEGHKSGWRGMAERNSKARRKLKSAITRQRNQIDRMGAVERLGARLSGKRRRIIREIMAKEDQLRAIDQLERRQQVLRRHFPL
ncbi:MAG: hypothetical protein QNJ44_05185 [Rhodobacter sp.]|nr:hypothetical protein [Rhodobacter sp.]